MMTNNTNSAIYWKQKEERARKAIYHTEFMDRELVNETIKAISATTFYDDSSMDLVKSLIVPNNKPNSEIIVDSVSTVGAINFLQTYDNRRKILALNFASYKVPGGGFIKGSSAQEESLCHASNLYNILEHFDDSYYAFNRKSLNNGIYKNRALYTPNVVFSRYGDCVIGAYRKVDILTCAAPNRRAQSTRVSKEDNNKAVEERCDFVCTIADSKNVDVLILGAWGCGVFGQNPYVVANAFKKAIRRMVCKPEKIVFAIPASFHRENFDAFKKVFSE